MNKQPMIEGAVLITLLRAGGTPLSADVIHARVKTRVDADITWRQVMTAITKHLHNRRLFVDGDEQAGGYMRPLYALTSAGEHDAHAAQAEERNAKQSGKPKTLHDDVREVRA